MASLGFRVYTSFLLEGHDCCVGTETLPMIPEDFTLAHTFQRANGDLDCVNEDKRGAWFKVLPTLVINQL